MKYFSLFTKLVGCSLWAALAAFGRWQVDGIIGKLLGCIILSHSPFPSRPPPTHTHTARAHFTSLQKGCLVQLMLSNANYSHYRMRPTNLLYIKQVRHGFTAAYDVSVAQVLLHGDEWPTTGEIVTIDRIIVGIDSTALNAQPTWAM